MRASHLFHEGREVGVPAEQGDRLSGRDVKISRHLVQRQRPVHAAGVVRLVRDEPPGADFVNQFRPNYLLKSYRPFFKEVSRGGEQTRVLSISFIFSFFTTLPIEIIHLEVE
jgi:hypothetical protein